MYPLHKYVPTPFGTYLMYINHGKERINVENFPKDMKIFNRKVAQNAKRFREAGEPVGSLAQGGASKQSSPSKEDLDVPPSYQIRFLEHTGQTVTEPPPNIILVDDITGADVTSSMTWIRNRPQRWKERLKVHEIENPEMTSTLKPERISENQRVEEERRRRAQLLELKKGRPKKVLPPPLQAPKEDPVRSSMLPHISKQPHPRRGREYREERDKEARKRRRRVNKIMGMVVNRAQVATMKSQSTPDKLFEINETKTSQYSSLGDILKKQRSLSVEPHFTASNRRADEPLRSSSELNYNDLRSRATIHEEKKAPKIQDWNPKEEHYLLNRTVLERLEATIPYKWNKRDQEHISQQSHYHYVL